MIDISNSRYKIVEPPKGAKIFLCNGIKFAVTNEGVFSVWKKFKGEKGWLQIERLTEINGQAYVAVTVEGVRAQFQAAKTVLEVVGKDYKPRGYRAECIDGNIFNLSIGNLKWVKSSAGRPKTT